MFEKIIIHSSLLTLRLNVVKYQLIKKKFLPLWISNDKEISCNEQLKMSLSDIVKFSVRVQNSSTLLFYYLAGTKMWYQKRKELRNEEVDLYLFLECSVGPFCDKFYSQMLCSLVWVLFCLWKCTCKYDSHRDF